MNLNVIRIVQIFVVAVVKLMQWSQRIPAVRLKLKYQTVAI